MRRREWSKKNTTPLYTIEKPRELVAVLAFALLKCAGDLTTEQKTSLLAQFESELKYTAKDAVEMYSYASYLLSTDPNFADKVRDICTPAAKYFSDSQRESALQLLASLVVDGTHSQIEFLDDVKAVMAIRA